MKNLTLEAAEKAAESIQAAKRSMAKIMEHYNPLATELNTLEDHLNQISQALLNPSPPLQNLQDRLRRIREIRNMMELGAFSIQTGQTLDKIWQSLP